MARTVDQLNDMLRELKGEHTAAVYSAVGWLSALRDIEALRDDYEKGGKASLLMAEVLRITSNAVSDHDADVRRMCGVRGPGEYAHLTCTKPRRHSGAHTDKMFRRSW